MEEEKGGKGWMYILVVIILVIVIWLFIAYRSSSSLVNPSPSGTSTPQAATTDQLAPHDSAVNATQISTGALVRILSPNGGEKWQRGKQYALTWDVKGMDASVPLYMDLIKTTSVFTDPYVVSSQEIGGYAPFSQSIYPQGLPAAGALTFTVPSSMAPGTYQVLLWAGSNCSVRETSKKCAYDVSDGLISIQ